MSAQSSRLLASRHDNDPFKPPVERPRPAGRRVQPTVAKIALEVVDGCQGIGLGRLLLEVIGAAAEDVGVTSLLWLMDETNRRVRLAAPLGGRFTLACGALEGTTPLPQVAALDAAVIIRCAPTARRRVSGRAAA